jgi:UDP-N-acetyl-D-glucosamine dehydrogenase
MEERVKVVVVGGGYVGLPLSLAAAQSGHDVCILDVDQKKVDDICNGRSPVEDVKAVALRSWLATGKLTATTDPSESYEGANVVLICVPTPLQPAGTPDVSFVLSAVETLVKHMGPMTLVALESTVYPGFTREVLVSKIVEAGFVVGHNAFVSFSPERVDPANEVWGIVNTPKVIGGVTRQCLAMAISFYAKFVKTVVPVESVEMAEMVKLLENTHRAVNIALVNEIAVICNRLGIDVWGVIDAAKTKPFGFTPFYPGPGCGGHCLPCDPQYLEWRMRTLKYEARMIHLAAQINSEMPRYVVERLASLLNARGLPLRKAKILLVGLAYKPNVNDFRESPSLEILHLLLEHDADVRCVEPYLEKRPAWLPEQARLHSTLPATLADVDASVITTDHSGIDYQRIVNATPLVFDTRNATKGLEPAQSCKIVKL